MNCHHTQLPSMFVPLHFQAARRSKGQRYYPRPPKAEDATSPTGQTAVRYSCRPGAAGGEARWPEPTSTRESCERSDFQTRSQSTFP